MKTTSESAALWRLAMEHSPIGVALVALDGRMLRVNQALADLLGYDAEELRGSCFQDLTHPDDLQEAVELLRRTAAGEMDSYRLRKRYLNAAGAAVWVDLSVTLVRDADGTPLHFISQIVDLTPQIAYERRLEEAAAAAARDQQTLEAIFEAARTGLLLIDRDGNYKRMNRRMEEALRLPFPDGHRGKAGQDGHVYSIEDGTRFTSAEMPSSRATQGEEFDDYTFWVGDDPLTREAHSVSARQVRTPSGERLGAVLAYQDVTDLIRALHVKDEFISSVSHELRTPLTSVLGHLEMLAEHPDLPPEVTNQLQVVERNARRLRALVSDLLHVAQAHEGALPLRRTEVDLRALAWEAIESARPWAAEKDVVLHVDAPESLPALVDAHRLRQVLDNLVSNAVKYTKPGGRVTLHLRSLADVVEIEVVDTGIGIAEQELDRVFGRFFRGGEALREHIPGTGLGLNIVQSIVRAHGGEVAVESQIGTGSTFRVTLPQAL